MAGTKVGAFADGPAPASMPGTGTGGTPGGSASGDLSGTYPAPVVHAINGVEITGTPAVDQIIVADSPTAASWQDQPASGLTSVTDGTTTVAPATSLRGAPHSVVDNGSGEAELLYVSPIYGGQETLNTVAASGATETLPAAANVHDITLTADCTLTLPTLTNAKACAITVILRQDGTGNRTVTWPGSVSWVTGTAPVLKTAAAAVDVITLFTLDGGTTWGGVAVPAAFSGGVPALTLGTANSAGSATTGIRTDATILAFDVTDPADVALVADDGAATVAARRDHVHKLTATLTAGVHAHIDLEQMTGDGATTLFYLAQEAQPDQPPTAFVNGAQTDVTLGGMNDTITFGAAPAAAALIRVSYLAAAA